MNEAAVWVVMLVSRPRRGGRAKHEVTQSPSGLDSHVIARQLGGLGPLWPATRTGRPPKPGGQRRPYAALAARLFFVVLVMHGPSVAAAGRAATQPRRRCA